MKSGNSTYQAKLYSTCRNVGNINPRSMWSLHGARKASCEAPAASEDDDGRQMLSVHRSTTERWMAGPGEAQAGPVLLEAEKRKMIPGRKGQYVSGTVTRPTWFGLGWAPSA